LPIPLPAPSTEGKYQLEAMIQRISQAIGFFVVPTPGTSEPSPGTGVLVQLQGRKYFVSALHCFFHDVGGNEQVVQSWNATRFRFRNGQPLGSTESLHDAAQRVLPDVGISLPVAESDLLINTKNDLIAARVTPGNALAHEEFFDLESEAFAGELTEGISLFMLGVPRASHVNVPGYGPTLIPQVEHVRFDPNIDTSGLAMSDKSPNYLYMPYSLTQDGIDPHGFSGAPIFVTKKPTEVWTASPHIVGIAQRFVRKPGILVVRKISVLVDLLRTDGERLR
jgi:hypothetical protein